jgi:hypothetical protein
LENCFIGVEPKDEDKSEWINVIPGHEVDWFSEYRRNHINSLAIRRTFANISNNAQTIVKEYGVVKQGVKQPAIFERGVIDREIDEHLAGLDLYCPISNDLRELLKVNKFIEPRDTGGMLIILSILVL